MQPLTRGTTDALQQIHRHQFCTTTYQQTYTNPWTRRLAELRSNPTSRAETSSGVTDEGDKNKEEIFDEYCDDGGSWDKEVAVKKRVHWQDKEGESEGEGESSRVESPKQVERGEEEVEEKEVEAERGSEGIEDTCDTETTGKELLDEEEKEKQKESVVTSPPQLPIHFRRYTSH